METSIPVFDLSSTSPSLADDLVAAAGQYGFLFIKSSDLDFSASDVSNTFSLSRKFFASPRPEKEACSMQHNNRGWTSMGSETLDPADEQHKGGDPKEAFNFGEFIDGRAQQPLPPAFRDHEAELARFSGLCYALCLRLLRLIALGLKIEKSTSDDRNDKHQTTTTSSSSSPPSATRSSLDEHWFSTRHDPRKGDSGTILRLLHYPASHSASPIRAGAHSDYGSLTLLFRLPGQPGLEILTPSGSWAAVPVQPAGTQSDPFPPILVNIGDLLSYWTCGLLKSTVHRVVGGGAEAEAGAEADASAEPRDRYSIAFFCHPCRDTALVPVPSEPVRERARRQREELERGGGGGYGYGFGVREAAVSAGSGRVLTADEHLHHRLAATYGWKQDDGAAVGA